MATGASNVDLTIILVDARNGVVEQTKRHTFIAALLGVPRLLVAINKMDLVDYSQARFEQIRDDFTEFSARLGVREVRFIPVSALEGDNIVEKSARMEWYGGETVLEHLETVYTAADRNLVDFRFPVQVVLNPNQNFRGYAGTVSSGVVRVGEEVLVLPSMRRSKVKSIVKAGRQLEHTALAEASSGEAVVVQLVDQIDISRGDMLVRPRNVPRVVSNFEAMMVWLGEEPMNPNTRYILRHATRETKGVISGVEYKIDIHTLGRTTPAPLEMNEIGRVSFTTTSTLFLDPYEKNRTTGNLIVIDPVTFRTVGAAMVIDRAPQHLDIEDQTTTGSNLHTEAPLVSRVEREDRQGTRALTLWLTGLSGSGKSTLAKAAERVLFDQGINAFFLDGDNLRRRLNEDLGFAPADRAENIRRAAEVATLLNEAGVTVICAFISPYAADRTAARAIVGEERFIEVFVKAPAEVCESRDPHGLYAKVRRGELKGFTGVDAPYEEPERPEIVVHTDAASVEACVQQIVAEVIGRGKRS
jgi:bifunctional enzyme CysN/CysC